MIKLFSKTKTNEKHFHLINNLKNSESLTATKSQSIITASNAVTFERAYCGNWNNAIEAIQGECSLHNHTVQCYGGAIHLHRLKLHRIQKIKHIIFCGWPNETFDPTILTAITKLKRFQMEYGNMMHITHDFPHLNHLQASILYQISPNAVHNAL